MKKNLAFLTINLFSVCLFSCGDSGESLTYKQVEDMSYDYSYNNPSLANITKESSVVGTSQNSKLVVETKLDFLADSSNTGPYLFNKSYTLIKIDDELYTNGLSGYVKEIKKMDQGENYYIKDYINMSGWITSRDIQNVKETAQIGVEAEDTYYSFTRLRTFLSILNEESKFTLLQNGSLEIDGLLRNDFTPNNFLSLVFPNIISGTNYDGTMKATINSDGFITSCFLNFTCDLTLDYVVYESTCKMEYKATYGEKIDDSSKFDLAKEEIKEVIRVANLY